MYILNHRSVSKTKPYLLLHCNGADESTTFTDSSPEGHTFTAINDAQIDTAQYKFNGASLLFDGTDDGIKTEDGDFNLSTNFTIDMFIRISNGAAQTIVGYTDAAADNFWTFFHNAGDLFFHLWDDDVRVVYCTGTSSISTNTWYHIALCKVGDEYGIYKDGTQVAHLSDSSTVSIPTDGALRIGINSDEGTGEFYGHMDEIRICKSNPFNANPVAGLTDKIQVPVQPYPSWV